MVRVKRGVTHRQRHNKILALTRGHSGGRHRLYKTAKESLVHAMAYQYRDRRNRKRDFRRLWIQRINAAAREAGISYSRLVAGLREHGIEINRKMLADLAVRSPDSFMAIVTAAQATAAADSEPSAISSRVSGASGLTADR